MSKYAVRGGPIIWPADPVAVAIPRASDRCDSGVDLPITARMIPNPVPAIPKPKIISSKWCASGVVARLEIISPPA